MHVTVCKGTESSKLCYRYLEPGIGIGIGRGKGSPAKVNELIAKEFNDKKENNEEKE